MNNINVILSRPDFKGCSSRGADMGRRGYAGEPANLHLQRLRFVDGDYDVGGAYWGYTPGTSLWCAFSDEDSPVEPTMLFCRAANREEAKKYFEAELPGDGWDFYR